VGGARGLVGGIPFGLGGGTPLGVVGGAPLGVVGGAPLGVVALSSFFFARTAGAQLTVVIWIDSFMGRPSASSRHICAGSLAFSLERARIWRLKRAIGV